MEQHEHLSLMSKSIASLEAKCDSISSDVKSVKLDLQILRENDLAHLEAKQNLSLVFVGIMTACFFSLAGCFVGLTVWLIG